jgi:hypothetical protein
MVNGVHNFTADNGAATESAIDTGFTFVLLVVLGVGDASDGSEKMIGEEFNGAGGEFEGDKMAVGEFVKDGGESTGRTTEF